MPKSKSKFSTTATKPSNPAAASNEGSDNAFSDPHKAILKPKNEGEDIKIKETVFARRERNLKAKAERASAIAAAKKEKNMRLKVEKLTSVAKVMQKATTRRADKSRIKRVKAGKTRKPRINQNNNGRIILIVRNNRMLSARSNENEVREVLKELDLIQTGTLVFMPNERKTFDMLDTVKPFVYWGFPSFKIVNELMHKKGSFKPSPRSQEKLLLTSNALLEQHLGDSCGVLCVEDLVSIIFNAEGYKFRSKDEELQRQVQDFKKSEEEEKKKFEKKGKKMSNDSKDQDEDSEMSVADPNQDSDKDDDNDKNSSIDKQNEESAFKKVLQHLWPLDLGDFDHAKAEKLKQDKRYFKQGNLGRGINELVDSVL